MRKILLVILFIVLIVALLYKSPFSAMYNYNKAKDLYKLGKYEQSLPYFEKALFASPKDELSRFYYVLALSKTPPTYRIQKRLYEMSESKIQDEASKYAKAQAVSLRFKLTEGINNNYIDNAVSGKDVIRWDLKSFPLKVYIEPTNDIPPFYTKTILKAFAMWQNKTNFISFTQTKNEQEANITVKFKDIPKDICKNSICTYTIANTTPEINNDKILKKMVLTFYKTNPFNKSFTEQEIFNTAIHEIGHTLGIMGHSDNPDDVMFAMKDNTDYRTFKTGVNAISARDIKTLVLLYRIAANITDTNALPAKNSYYAPLILGSNDVRLQKKLQENLNYIKNYPKLASGYINISGVYTEMGDFDNALISLNKAKELSVTQEEQYIIEYNLAITYYNKQDYQKAYETALKARTLKSDENINDLITELEELKK